MRSQPLCCLHCRWTPCVAEITATFRPWCWMSPATWTWSLADPSFCAITASQRRHPPGNTVHSGYLQRRRRTASYWMSAYMDHTTSGIRQAPTGYMRWNAWPRIPMKDTIGPTMGQCGRGTGGGSPCPPTGGRRFHSRDREGHCTLRRRGRKGPPSPHSTVQPLGPSGYYTGALLQARHTM
jgi:hypothetical protein